MSIGVWATNYNYSYNFVRVHDYHFQSAEPTYIKVDLSNSDSWRIANGHGCSYSAFYMKFAVLTDTIAAIASKLQG